MRTPPRNVLPFGCPPRRRWTREEDYGAPGPRNPWPKAEPPARPRGSRLFSTLLVGLPLAAFTAVFLWDGPPAAMPFPTPADRESARFGTCSGPVRINCVVDGDTFWYRGEKIRIADINTPEVSDPGCAYEAQLGAKATRRLRDLLNQGPFTLEPIDHDHDQYGRSLRVVTRGGVSLGDTLVSEGLAEEWKGYRGEWC